MRGYLCNAPRGSSAVKVFTSQFVVAVCRTKKEMGKKRNALDMFWPRRHRGVGTHTQKVQIVEERGYMYAKYKG